MMVETEENVIELGLSASYNGRIRIENTISNRI